MIGRRIRRLLWRFLVIVAAVVVALALLVVFLWIRAPAPRTSAGWSRLADMPDRRGEVAAAATGGELVVAGGLRGIGGTSDAVSVYDIARDRWRAGPTLPQPRHHAAAAALGEVVYVSGGAAGATDWTPRAEVWRLRPGGAWEAVEDMPEGRQGHAMVAFDGRLYVLGGVGPTDRTLVYAPEEGWSFAAPLPVGRDHLRAAVWGDEIWVLGGRSGDPLRRIDVYDPRTDRFRVGPDLPVRTSAMAVGVVGDRLHVVGGEDPNLVRGRVTDVHFALGPDGRRWQEPPDAVLGVHGAGFATHDGRLYIAGGASRQGGLSVISWTGVTQVYSGD